MRIIGIVAITFGIALFATAIATEGTQILESAASGMLTGFGILALIGSIK